MKKNIIIILLLSISLFKTDVYSQGIDAGINFLLAFPQNEFKANVNKIGYGFGGHLVWLPAQRLPVGLGLDLGFITYGNEQRKAPWSTTIPDAYVNVDRSNNIFNFHLKFQIVPFNGDIRPYAEGLFGGAYFYTSTEVKSDYDNKQLTSSTNFEDWAWSYGGGAGIMIKVYEGMNEKGKYKLFLDLNGKYLKGTEAKYLKEGSVTISNGKIYYDVSKSKTDLIQVHLGVVFSF